MDKHFFKLWIVIICLFASIPLSATKPLKTEELNDLVNVVRERYASTMMQGAEVIKIGSRNVLVSVVGVTMSPNSQRIAQVKAARAAGEFLEGATNKSITVYEIVDNSAYALKSNSSISDKPNNSIPPTHINQQTNNLNAIETTENFTDKMYQSSISQVKHMEPLCRVGNYDGEIIFAYYIILK